MPAIMHRAPHAGSYFVAAAIGITLALLIPGVTMANDLRVGLATFVQESCIGCHDASTETRLDFTSLGYDLKDKQVFGKWVRVFDRIQRREMPPKDETQPSETSRSAALSLLQAELKHVNRRSQQEVGRVPTRRLTRQEYEYTLHDLLGIGGDLAKHLPPENESGSFDVVAASQEMSSVHVRSLLTAADLALDEAIQLGERPPMKPRDIDYFNSPYIQMWVDREVRRGGGTIFKTDQDIVTFRGENFVFRSDAAGFRPPVAGRYRVTVKAAAHQPRSSITVSLKRQNDEQGESGLFGAWDLVGEDYREVSTVTYLRPDDYIYVSADELEPAPNGRNIYNSQPASEFGGEGVKVRRVTVEGPLEGTWPPQRTRNLFPGVNWRESGQLLSVLGLAEGYIPELSESPEVHLRIMVAELAPRAFRRAASGADIDVFVELAKSRLKSKRDFLPAARIALRAILVSPELMFLTGPAGPLDDAGLASRLSYFLWRSIPDEELTKLARDGHLSERETLLAQVDRMLDDPKGQRFVDDFLDQWLDLNQIDATTPDAFLYPEYDDVLRQAMLAETREFFAHLLDENLSVANLIDSDFTFLNRRLAEHYGIAGVEGEHMRKVKLPADSVRGGILGHASIAKVTANGTVTTPVKRGNFVLTNLLGLPPNPPPPGVGAIEPDTRGATTIRETLKKHQAVSECAACHKHIDPPGFALECFDPIGNFRKRYRNSTGLVFEVPAGLRLLRPNYLPGRFVDSSGVTAGGQAFKDIREYRKHLAGSTEQIARNVLSKLIAFSTGAEVQFSDREEVERILKVTRDDGYPLRSLIHHTVTSRMFRNR